MLDLNAPEWATIKSSPGGNGLLTAELLRQLANGDESAFAELYEQTCHQYTAEETVFVAVPHMVAIARTAAPPLRALLLTTVGVMVASRVCHHRYAAKPRPEWNAEFEAACTEARNFTAETLKDLNLDPDDSITLIGALAAFHGHAHLAMLAQDGPEFWCPECGEPIQFG